MPYGSWINDLPTSFFLVVHITAFVLGAGFAWLAFKRELTLLAAAFSSFAVAELARRNVICDTRPDAGIRFGPHFFTTDDEIRFAVEQVQEILESGAHLERAHAAAGY